MWNGGEGLSEIESYWLRKENWSKTFQLGVILIYFILFILIMRKIDVSFLIIYQEMGRETAQFFVSTIFQSLTALFGLIFISFFFAYERLERKFDERRKAIPYYCTELSNSIGVSITPYGISNQGRLFMMLLKCESKLKDDLRQLVNEWNTFSFMYSVTSNPLFDQSTRLIERRENLENGLMTFNESLGFFNRFKSIGSSIVTTIMIFMTMFVVLLLPMIFSMSYLYSLDAISLSDLPGEMFIIYQLTFIGIVWVALLGICMLFISISKSMTRPETSPEFNNNMVLSPLLDLLNEIRKKEMDSLIVNKERDDSNKKATF
jgi:hypothetical protein